MEKLINYIRELTHKVPKEKVARLEELHQKFLVGFHFSTVALTKSGVISLKLERVLNRAACPP